MKTTAEEKELSSKEQGSYDCIKRGNSSKKPVTQSNTKSVSSLLSGGGTAIPLFKVFMPESILEPVNQVLMSGYIGEGPRVKQFEQELTPWFGNPNVLALNSGTSALQLALRLSDVGVGDEVISTAMTCTATNEPIMAMGARIVWADIDPWTGNLDPADVEKKITPRTKAIMCVHWGGYPCELAELNAIAQKHGIKVIEDAAHAFGGEYHGTPIGSHSDFSCFSFQAIKHMTTVDGGALTCRSVDDLDRGRLLRWYGIDRNSNRKDFRCEDDILEYGYKFHMNDVAATIGLEQLKHVGETVAKHRANAKAYDEAFAELDSIKTLRHDDQHNGAYWLYTLRAKDARVFMAYMKDKNIVTSAVHARNDTHTMFKDFQTDLPGVDEFVSEQVSIPVGWWLTEQDRNAVIEAVQQYRA